MKTKSYIIQSLLIAAGALLVANGCSSLPGQSESGKSISSTGPTVLNARAEPSTVELNRNLQPIQNAEIVADVKDFTSKVTSVKLRFVDVPIQVPMENIGGTTWRAQLSSGQLRALAVSGKTINYDANIIAKNEKGQTAMSSSPVTVAVAAPDLSRSS
jgi:hypothetical protein